ncbi:MAG: hypothetical protein ACJ796_04560 [Gemmatimonadaceae bacterium]
MFWNGSFASASERADGPGGGAGAGVAAGAAGAVVAAVGAARIDALSALTAAGGAAADEGAAMTGAVLGRDGTALVGGTVAGCRAATVVVPRVVSLALELSALVRAPRSRQPKIAVTVQHATNAIRPINVALTLRLDPRPSSPPIRAASLVVSGVSHRE